MARYGWVRFPAKVNTFLVVHVAGVEEGVDLIARDKEAAVFYDVTFS